MLKAIWMMKFLKSRNLKEVIRMLKVDWIKLKEGFESSLFFDIYILSFLFFFLERSTEINSKLVDVDRKTWHFFYTMPSPVYL